MDPAEHFRAIWARKWIVLAMSLLVAAGVYAWSSQRTKVYSSTTVVDTLAGATHEGNTPTQDAVAIITSRNAALVGTSSFQRDAIDRAGLDIPTSVAASRLSASAADSAGFLQIVATGPTGDDAQDLARGAAEALVDVNKTNGNTVKLVTPAALPDAPQSPRPLRDALLAFLVALIVDSELAALLARLFDRMDTRQHREEFDQPDPRVITYLPRRRPQEATEAFWELRAAVDLAPEPIHSLAIIEEHPNSDGTLVGIGLAQAAANARTHVTLVDANLRTPTVSTAMGMHERGGLAEALRGQSVDGLLQTRNPLQSHYRVLVAGGRDSDPPGRLGSGGFHKVLDGLFVNTEFVIALTPPMNAGIDAIVIAAQCDAILLVLDARRSSARSAETFVKRLEPTGTPVLGSVVTRANLPRQVRRRLKGNPH